MTSHTRRNFIQSATAAAVYSSPLLRCDRLMASPFGLPIGLQLYSVREMMAKDPKLKAEFEKKVASDPEFAGSAAARLNFFYERSPWFAANRVGMYPVGRLLTLDGVPVK